MSERQPIGYAIITGYENDIESITFTADRQEAHRIFANAQQLDDEVVARSKGAVDSATVTLTNVYDEKRLYDDLVTTADPAEHAGETSGVGWPD